MDNLAIKIVRQSDGKKFEISNSHDWVVVKDGLEGFGEISNSLSFTDNAYSDGGIITDEHVTKKDRTIKAGYRHSNIALAKQNADSFFSIKDTYKVIVTHGQKNVFAMGKIEKYICKPVHLDNGKLELAVTFLFANPFWKSVDDFGKNIAALSGMIAFPYLCSVSGGVIGTTGGIFNYAEKTVLSNNGDVATKCKVVIAADGEVFNPKIIINGEYVRVLDTLEADDRIEMDFEAQPPTVKKNGVNWVGKCDRTSAFQSIILARGDNEIEYDADNGSSHMNVTVYYNKQYEVV